MDLRPARDRRGELAANMLDLGQQVEGGQVLRPLLENVRDLDLGVVEFSDLDKDTRVPDPVLRREEVLLPRRRDRLVRRHGFYSRTLPLPLLLGSSSYGGQRRERA